MNRNELAGSCSAVCRPRAVCIPHNSPNSAKRSLPQREISQYFIGYSERSFTKRHLTLTIWCRDIGWGGQRSITNFSAALINYCFSCVRSF